MVEAAPFASVLTIDDDKVPAVVVNETGADGSVLPLMSKTVAETVVEPPFAGTNAGLAFTLTRPTAAVPTAILIAPSAPVVAPPDVAVMTADPFAVPEKYLTTTRPPTSVCAWAGCIVPSVVVNVTNVPLWGGVPAASSTVAIMSVVAPTGSALVEAVRTIVDPAGAIKGTFSHPETRSETAAAANTAKRPLGRVIMKPVNILVPMHLAGQHKPASSGPALRTTEGGYAMAVLLVAMSVMAVMMTVAMPVWKQMSQREKEAELVFRGRQYARAIELMQRKIPGALPPNLDILVSQKFLRKKYKDPITGQDFDTVTPLQTAPAAAPGTPPGGRGGPGGAAGPGRSNTPATQPGAPGGAARPGAPGGGAPGGGPQGGIIGVVSKSKDTSIRLYEGRSHYNEWIFQAVQRTQTPGGATGAGTPGRGGGPGEPTPGGRGGRGQPPGGGRGGPGMPPPGGRGPAFPPPPGRQGGN